MPSPAIEPLGGMVRRFADRYPGVEMVLRDASEPGTVADLVRTGVAGELARIALSRDEDDETSDEQSRRRPPRRIGPGASATRRSTTALRADRYPAGH
ncbi:MAG TPA: hypothetical protein VIL71_04620 [Spirillospora sp.]